MIEVTDAEEREIQERIAAAWDSATMDIVDKLVSHLQALGIDVPTVQELAKSAVSGSLNDPAYEHAMADYTHPNEEVMHFRKLAHRKMFEDIRTAPDEFQRP
jgi:hypothetical protein